METAEFIIEKVAPLFNRQGYVGTSLADITKATGFTKGAIYCNFSNKEDLAIKAFDFNIKFAIAPLFKKIADIQGSINKLYAITNYHRSYYDLVIDRGGCPILRAGIDTKFINPFLFEKARKLSEKMMNGLISIIQQGITDKEIQEDIIASKQAKIFLSMIEGSSFLSFTHNDNTFISEAMDYLDNFVIEVMKK